MFSRYKKPLKAQPVPTAQDTSEQIPSIQAKVSQEIATEVPTQAPKKKMRTVPAKPDDKEKKRRERMGEIKLQIHKELLDNLNLAALERASETDLKAEISAISAETLDDLGVVLNRDDRASLIQDLYDEVTGLGPLETLLKDDDVNDILVNGPQQVFVERDGKLMLSDVTFKDERHLLRIIDKIVSAVGGAWMKAILTSTRVLLTAHALTQWSHPSQLTAAWCPFGNSSKIS